MFATGGSRGMNSRCTYFDLIQVSFSSLLDCAIGLCLPFTFISQMLLHSSFPIDNITAINSRLYSIKKNFINTYIHKDPNTNLHSSSSRDLILEICDPKFLCIPEHWMHSKQPKFSDAHSGSTQSFAMHYIISSVTIYKQINVKCSQWSHYITFLYILWDMQVTKVKDMTTGKADNA